MHNDGKVKDEKRKELVQKGEEEKLERIRKPAVGPFNRESLLDAEDPSSPGVAGEGEDVSRPDMPASKDTKVLFGYLASKGLKGKDLSELGKKK